MSKSQCPFCGHEGLRIVYGLLPGPPDPAEVSGGCAVFPGRSPEYECPWCDAEWIRKHHRVTVVTSLGANQASDLPPNVFLVTTLERAADALRNELDSSGESTKAGTEAALERVGKDIGLSAQQSQILIAYL